MNIWYTIESMSPDFLSEIERKYKECLERDKYGFFKKKKGVKIPKEYRSDYVRNRIISLSYILQDTVVWSLLLWPFTVILDIPLIFIYWILYIASGKNHINTIDY